jgi:two-component system OmpR family response regulator
MRILVVEDDAKLAALLRRALTERGQATDVAACAEDALWMVHAHAYDVLMLDVRLPGMDGFDLCRALRAEGVGTPVLMLTARSALADRIRGLDAGADDYLVKPFSLAELLARLRALVRRSATQRPGVLIVDDLRLDPAAHTVWRADVEVQLSTKEFALLELFMRRPGEVISRTELLEHGWDMADENRSNVITVFIRTLREKIDRPFGRASLETVRGAGYRLRASSDPERVHVRST